MRKIFLYYIASFLLTSCQEVVEIDLPTAEPRLVIDANFNIFLNEPSLNINNFIKLTLTAPFFAEEVPVVNNATVFITDIDNGTIFNFEELNDSGIYIPQNQDMITDLEFDTTFELTVIHTNETYVATAKFIPSVPIDSIEIGDTVLFDENETELIISFTDDATRNDFYLFNLDFGLFLTTEDEFYQGEEFVFSYFYENLSDGQDIDFTLSGVDKQFHSYLTLLIEQNGQNGGGPFQSTPATLIGNIVNITNPDNYPLGYFSISEANSFSITIE